MTLSRWCPVEGLAAGHRVQPWSQPLGVAELAEALGRDQEGVLGGVGRLSRSRSTDQQKSCRRSA
jgi:hypothetical protein